MWNKKPKIMKLKTNFRKLTNGRIEATIRITDHEDFPESTIFDLSDFSTKSWKCFEHDENSYIFATFDTPDLAQDWINAEIDNITILLDAWRSIELPAEREYSI